jgi:alanyl-tRNA synthetase
LASNLKSDTASLPSRVQQLQDTIKQLEADKKKLQQMVASGAGQDMEAGLVKVGDINVLATVMDGADKDLMRSSIDKFKDKYENGIIVLGAEVDGKVKVLAGVSKGISKRFPAGELIKHISGLVGGRGGGRPDMAEGGIPDVADLHTCLEAVTAWVGDKSS